MNIQSVESDSVIQNVMKCVAFSLLIGIGAQVSIPCLPVPFTLQTMCVFWVVSQLGKKWGTFAIIMYLFEGLMGLPVFANLLGGPSIILGPTGGYLLGFVPAAYIIGMALEHSKSWKSIIVGIILAEIALFLCGYFQLALFTGAIGAYYAGIEPFFVSETIKIIASVLCIKMTVKA